MNFLDTARIYVRGGHGGDGCLAFRREKFVEMGGPNGGNGGKGGDVWLVADAGLTTLLDLGVHPHIRGGDGSNGKGSNKYGRGGEDRVVLVPAGTIVRRQGRVLADLAEPGQRLLVAKGGRGGRGNAVFKSSRNTAPRIAERGEPGEDYALDLELKLLADVGLLGLPNAGKSTFLARVSNARPKIADYPFTTLAPNLGLVHHRKRSFVLADIPGLIEGAHEGKGLGSAFLRHVERTKVLIHLVDPLGFSGKTAAASLKVIESELRDFGHGLAAKPRIVVISKADLPEAKAVYARLKKARPALRLASAATGEGLSALLDAVVKLLDKPRQDADDAAAGLEPLVFQMAPGFEVRRDDAGTFLVSGEKVEKLVRMTNFEQPEAVRRFQNILEKIGLDRELRGRGVLPGDTVRVGSFEFEWQDQAEIAIPYRARKGRPKNR